MKIRYILKFFSFLPLNVFLRFTSLGYISINWKAKISPFCTIRRNRHGRITIGKNANFRSFSEVHADGGIITIGNNLFINRNSMIISHSSITIGNNVTIGPNVLIYDHDHDREGKILQKPIVIGDDVWIAGCVTILKGVTIGKRSIIGAGSVVTKDVPDYSVLIQKRNSTII